MKHDDRLAALETLRLAHPEHDLVIREVQQILTRMNVPHENELTVTTLVSQRTGEAKLDVVWLGQLTQMSPEAARSTAWVLVEAASVAETEAVFMRFLRDRLEMTPPQAATLIADLRTHRESLIQPAGTKEN